MIRSRFAAVIGFLLVAAVMVTIRLAGVMIVDHQQWDDLAVRQQQRTVTAPGQRGAIVSDDGYVLATSLHCVALQVDTKLLEHRQLFIPAAAGFLGLEADEISRRIDSGPRAIWLAQQVDPELAEEIRDLAPSAVVQVPDSCRVYPLGQVAAPVIGFVGREELRTVGRSGTEYLYDSELSGRPGRYLVLRDAVQRQIRLEALEEGRAGVDLHLNLNAQLQARAEAILEEHLDEVGGASASAVVLEAHTGAVRALVSLPSFDPASPGSDPRRWRLTPVQDAFEPGSTVKPIVAALALGHGSVRDDELFDCRHRGIEIAGRWIRDHAEPGLYTADEVVILSANAGIIEMAQRLDSESLYHGFELFGFGRRTGIRVPAEARGIMKGVDEWSKMSRAGFALGQELTTSPLQIAAAYAAIANGGWWIPPRLVREHDVAAVHVPRILSRRLAERLQEMLEGVVTEGTGHEARVPGIRVAGKTGTAQRAVAGGFDDEHHAAWFAGFLPMPDPEYVIVVVIDEPEKDFWASTVAAPAFAEIATALANVVNLPSSIQTDVDAET